MKVFSFFISMFIFSSNVQAGHFLCDGKSDYFLKLTSIRDNPNSLIAVKRGASVKYSEAVLAALGEDWRKKDWSTVIDAGEVGIARAYFAMFLVNRTIRISAAWKAVVSSARSSHLFLSSDVRDRDRMRFQIEARDFRHRSSFGHTLGVVSAIHLENSLSSHALQGLEASCRQAADQITERVSHILKSKLEPLAKKKAPKTQARLAYMMAAPLALLDIYENREQYIHTLFDDIYAALDGQYLNLEIMKQQIFSKIEILFENKYTHHARALKQDLDFIENLGRVKP